MKLLLENWRKYLAENKKTTILPGPVKLYTSGLYSSNMETVTVGKKGQEVEIVSGWQDQGVEFKLINVDGIEGWVESTALDENEEYYEVDALDENEEYCPACVQTMDEAKKKPCKPSKGKRFAKRVDGKCRSYGQAGQAKGGGDRIRPGTKKGDAYCARSAGIKKCKNPPCANTLSRKKWKCRGKKSMKSE